MMFKNQCLWNFRLRQLLYVKSQIYDIVVYGLNDEIP